MHIKKNKLILFIILISITDFSFAEKAPFESTYEALPPTIQYSEMLMFMMERVMSFLK